MLRSLRFRLLAGGALLILFALIVAGSYIVESFTLSIEADRRDDLESGLERIIAAIDPTTSPISVGSPLSDPRYDTPLSGMYWQVDDLDTGEHIRSRSLWDTQLPLSPGTADGKGVVSEIPGPQGQRLIFVSRAIRMAAAGGERRFNVALAEERGRDDNPIQRFGADLRIALITVGATLLLATILQVYFGLRPLVVLRRRIEDVRSGKAERLPVSRTAELTPITAQINELLDAQDASIAFARGRAADLAHGLKTPLAVLSATGEKLRAAGDEETADVLALLSEQMNARVDYQLRLARLRYRTRAQGASASINEAVLRSVAVLRRSPEGETINWLVDLENDLVVNADSHDLIELAGILLENAGQWAASRVQIACMRKDGNAELVVEDDGHGLNDQQIARLGARGLRLDESSTGTGIGLSIAFEIVALNHGSIVIDRSQLGGLRATVRLPLAR